MFFNVVRKICLAIVFLTLCLHNPVAAADLENLPSTASSDSKCYNDGDIITLRGMASLVSITLADNTTSDVWVLTSEKPFCIIQSNGDEAPQAANIFRFQIIGSPPPTDATIELKGKLSTDNITQYYVEPNAIEVISGRRIASQQPITVSQSASTADNPPSTVETNEEKTENFSWTPFMILVFLLILLSAPLISSRQQKKREREFENKLINLIKEHGQTLSRKRHQKVYQDDYGNYITADWEKEKAYFRDNVVFPRFSASDRKIYDAAGYNVEFAIETTLNTHYIKRDSSELDELSFSPAMPPYDYEKFCAELLKKAGWNAWTTKASGDQGSDVIAEKNGVRVVLQCKLYTQPVGNKAVQEVFAAKTFEKADHAAVVSNETYTPSARKIASSTGISLLHHDELLQWAENYSP